MIDRIEYEDHLGNSDHLVLTFIYKLAALTVPVKYSENPKFFRGNYAAINRNLNIINWDEELGAFICRRILEAIYRYNY